MWYTQNEDRYPNARTKSGNMIQVILTRVALHRIWAGTNISSIECQTSRQSVAKQNGIIVAYEKRIETLTFFPRKCATNAHGIALTTSKKNQLQRDMFTHFYK